MRISLHIILVLVVFNTCSNVLYAVYGRKKASSSKIVVLGSRNLFHELANRKGNVWWTSNPVSYKNIATEIDKRKSFPSLHTRLRIPLFRYNEVKTGGKLRL